MKKRRIRWILGLVLMLVGAYVFGSQISVEKNRDKYSQVTILSLDKQIEAVCQDYQKVLSQTDLQKLEQTLLEQTGALKAAGWSERSIAGPISFFWSPSRMWKSCLPTWTSSFSPARSLAVHSFKTFGIWKQITWTAREPENSWNTAWN